MIVQNVFVKKEVNKIPFVIFTFLYISLLTKVSFFAVNDLGTTIDAYKAPIIEVLSEENLEDEPELMPNRNRKKRSFMCYLVLLF